MLASERRAFILQQITDNGRVRASDLAAALSVSRMTVHRDLAEIEGEGLIERVFGGAVAIQTAATQAAAALATGDCPMCGMRVRQRTVCVLHYQDGSQIRACCPHCGLMLSANRPQAVTALAADYLHGRMINVRSAVFLISPDITICCTPAVLCFENQADAARFQAGFGGEIMSLIQAQAHLQQHMALDHHGV